MTRFLLLSLIGLSALAQALAIRGATVINPRFRTVAANQMVVVVDGIIRSAGKFDGRIPPRAREIKAKGRYLIPGLWDNHVHLSKAGELALPLFVANGITSVRDVGSNLEEVVAWRSQIEAGAPVANCSPGLWRKIRRSSI